jgi:hypothetical protein
MCLSIALDHPEAVDRIAVLDIVSTAEMWRRADKDFGLVDWHWFFLAQPEPFPEQVIGVALRRLASSAVCTCVVPGRREALCGKLSSE